MKFGFVKCGTFVPKIKVADVKHNVEEIKRGITIALKSSVEVLSFPELSLTGSSLGDLFYSDTLLEAGIDGIKSIAKFTEGINMLCLIGMPIKKDGKIYNVCAAVSNGKILAFIPKTNLVNYGACYEKRVFSNVSGEEKIKIGEEEILISNDIIFVENGGKLKVGVEIGSDLETITPPSNGLAEGGANLIVNISATPILVESSENIKLKVKEQSKRLTAAYSFINCGEGESTTDEVFGGYSVIAEDGKILAESKPFNMGLTVTEIDVDYLSFERAKTFNGVNKPNTYGEIFFDGQDDGVLTRKYTKTPFVPIDKDRLKERAELVISIQAEGLKKRIEHTNSKTVVIGLSGGLDSTLAVLVCAKTMKLLNRTNKDIITCTMPCFGTTSRTYQNTIKLAKALNTTLKKIDIGKAVERHLKDIKHKEGVFDATFENAQARERTQVLMDVANMNDGIVIGTGDMSELALGWATYNGDHMSMYGVNCSVTKTLVRAVVECEAKKEKGKLRAVLEDILDTPVSPELLPAENGEISQKTEDLVGPYILHDFYLYHLLRRGTSPKKVYYIAKQTFNGEFDEKTILKWLKNFVKRFFAQQFKRSCVPDGVKVGSIDLSPRGSLKIPSDAVSNVWLEELENL